MHSDRKQISGCQGKRGAKKNRREGLPKGTRKLLRVMDMFTICDFTDIHYYTYVKTLNCLNLCSLLYVNNIIFQ